MTKTASAVCSVYVVSGAESFLRSAALEDIRRSVTQSPAGEVQVTRLEGDQAALADVLDEVRTFSLLGGLRLVIVDEADGFITRYRQPLERYCAAPSSTGVLVLVCDTFDKRTRLYKILSGAGGAIECTPLKGRATEAWIARRAHGCYGKTLAPDAAAMLHELIGDSLGELDGELDKLSTYVGPRPAISREDIDLLVGDHRERNVFALLDAMVDGQTAAALKRWQQVLATDRAAEGRSIAGLAWGVRQLLDARRAYEAGTPVRDIAQRIRSDPVRLRQRLDAVTARGLERRLADLLAADVAVKTGGTDVDSAVQKWIITHART